MCGGSTVTGNTLYQARAPNESGREFWTTQFLKLLDQSVAAGNKQQSLAESALGTRGVFHRTNRAQSTETSDRPRPLKPRHPRGGLGVEIKGKPERKNSCGAPESRVRVRRDTGRLCSDRSVSMLVRSPAIHLCS